MSKKLSLLLVPGILVTGCFGIGKAFSFKEFQNITKSSLSGGIQIKGNFSIKFERFTYNIDGQKIVDEAATRHYSMMKNGEVIYSLRIGTSEEYVFNISTYKTYQRNADGYFVKTPDLDCRTLEPFHYWVNLTIDSETEILKEQNGEYTSKKDHIEYKMDVENKASFDATVKKKADGYKLSKLIHQTKDPATPYYVSGTLTISSYSAGTIDYYEVDP